MEFSELWNKKDEWVKIKIDIQQKLETLTDEVMIEFYEEQLKIVKLRFAELEEKLSELVERS